MELEPSMVRRLEREKAARKHAEHILKQKSEELFHRNEELAEMTRTLEVQVEERTRDLALARDQALGAARARSDFIANMSHELRTPLNGVLGTLRMLASTQLSESQRKLVQIANESGSHLLDVINDVLDFSKIDAGKMKLEMLPVDLPKLISGVVETMTSAAESKGLRLHFEQDDSFPSHIEGDPLRLKQILLNLLSNAIKFTADGEVVIGLSQRSDVYQLTVRDTGIGISAEQQTRIFQAFDQADGSITRQFGGTGLGLSICGRLTDLMGGSISVSSEAGAGTEFMVTLPLVSKDESPLADELPIRVSNDFEHLRVLLAEDNAINQMVASHLLEDMGFSVYTANNGLEALTALNHRHFDLVLMDLQMPEMGGIEATRRIRASDQAYRNIPIVAMTAHTHEEHLRECTESGMNAHLSKPIDPQHVAQVLRHVLEKNAPEQIAQPSLSVPLAVPASERVPVTEPAAAITQPGHQALNLSATLSRLGGASDIIMELVQRFLHKHAGDGRRLLSAIDENDLPEAASLLHSLKGSSVNLGAEQLGQWATDLEDAARAGDTEQLKEGIQHFDDIWGAFTNAAEHALAEYRQSQVPLSDFDVLTAEQVEDRLTMIHDVLHEDLSLVCEHIDQLNRSRVPPRYQRLVSQMKTAIEAFDIDSLAELLQTRRGESE